ncbi:MAG: hypothetical protein GY835_26120 [bacterium]|nr:hypothetical protein [bacterium]
MRRFFHFVIFIFCLFMIMELSWGLSVWLEAGRWPGTDLSGLSLFTTEQARELRTYLNDEHLSAVDNSGFTSIADDTEVDDLLDSGKLKRIIPGLVGLRDVSYPYLRTDAYFEADLIARLFYERLQEMGISNGRILISSALRTMEFQERLRGENDNATVRSSHTSGLAFDLHYERFGPGAGDNKPEIPWRKWWWNERERRRRPDDAQRLKGLLASILIREQALGRILVIYEEEQPVFHVTVLAPLD